MGCSQGSVLQFLLCFIKIDGKSQLPLETPIYTKSDSKLCHYDHTIYILFGEKYIISHRNLTSYRVLKFVHSQQRFVGRVAVKQLSY